jgi:hypothetical protein
VFVILGFFRLIGHVITTLLLFAIAALRALLLLLTLAALGMCDRRERDGKR